MKYLVWLALFFCCTLQALAKPPIFSNISWDKAQSQAKQEKQWLIVDFSAVWCAPCQKMDKTTWQDPAVLEHLEDRAILIQLDLDEHSDLAKNLKIVGVPTLLIFQDGQEIDRSTGLKSSQELIDWLNEVERGGNKISLFRKALKQDPDDLDSLYELADALTETGEYKEATDIYIRLWEDMKDTRFGGVRLSYLIDSMNKVSELSPYSKEAVNSLKSEISNKVLGETASADEIVDWIALEEHDSHEDGLMDWYSSLEEPKAELYDKSRPAFFRMFLKAERTKEAGLVFIEPVVWAEAQIKGWKQLSDTDDIFKEYAHDQAVLVLGGLYRSLQDAGRERKARELKKRVFRHYKDPSVRDALK